MYVCVYVCACKVYPYEISPHRFSNKSDILNNNNKKRLSFSSAGHEKRRFAILDFFLLLIRFFSCFNSVAASSVLCVCVAPILAQDYPPFFNYG